MAEKQYYPIEVTTSNGIILSGDYIIATPDGVPLLAAFFDRAKAKVKACACQFGSGMVRFGWDRFYTARHEFGTVYKPVRMGRDRFIYAFTYNKEIGDNYLITTKESFHKDFYNLLLNKFHLPIMEEWIPYLLAAGRDKGYFFEIRYLKKRCADHERKVPVNGKMIPVTELNVVDLRQLTEERLKELISSGLKEKKICISKTEQAPLEFSSFDEYITRYGSAIVDKLESQLNPLSPLKGTVDEVAFKHKRLYPQQGACINGIKALRKSGSRYGLLVEGMGCGKTLQGAGICDAYANEKWLDAHPGKTLVDLYKSDEVAYRNIMMAPSHLVEKWKEEILSEVPNTKVTIINDFSQLVKLRAEGKTRRGREWYLISKDFCKLGSLYSPIPTNVTRDYPHLNFCKDCFEERGVYVPMTGSGKKECCADCGGKKKLIKTHTDYGKFYGMACPDCGRLLIKYSPRWFNSSLEEPADFVLKPRDFASRNASNSTCYNCGTQLWGVDVKPVDCGGEYSSRVKNHKPKWHKISHYKNYAKKGKTTAFVLRGRENEYLEANFHEGLTDIAREYGPRKSAPSLFIKKYLKGYFDFCVLDEAHKYEKGGTAQTNAAHALINASDFTLCLTGTLTNGKADSLFYLLYLLDPRKMVKAGYSYSNVTKFVEVYGSVETVYESDGDGVYNSCSRGRVLQSPKVKPGISPLLVTDFLLEKSVFLDLSDLSKYLPELKEEVTLVQGEDDMMDAYRHVIDKLKSATHEGEGRSVMSDIMKFGLSYLDKPYGRSNIMSKTKKDEVVAFVPNLDEYQTKLLPKEKALVERINQEIKEDRNCFVYASYIGEPESNVAYRLKDVIEKHCNLKGQVYVLTATNPSPTKRERFLKQKAAEGFRVIICNPKCVETGLDFCFWFGGKWYNYPTLIFYQISYELSVIWQASRRAYRLIQTEECRNVYFGYENTLQAEALQIMAEKQVAASAVQGKFSVEGLSALAKGVDPRLKLAQMLSAGDTSTRDSLENMFRALNKQNAADDDAYDDYVPPKTYYELMGMEETKETTSTNSDFSIFDVITDEKPVITVEESELRPVVEPKEVKKPKKKEQTNKISSFEEVSLFDFFGGFDDFFTSTTEESQSKGVTTKKKNTSVASKPKKKRAGKNDLYEGQPSIFDLAV